MSTNNRRRKSNQQFNYEKLECRKLLAIDAFAPIDGFGNNLENPEFGTPGEQLIRIAPAAYVDGLNEPPRLDEWNAREISNLIADQENSIENERFLTSMWFQWGQFLDHDIDRDFDMTSEPEPLDIAPGFPFNRSVYDPETGITTPREHVNHITAFIDGSAVYGSDVDHAMSLRTMVGGKLDSQDTGVGELLPSDPFFFVAGDVRSNENVGLTSMHTLWVREHNRLADKFADELAETEFAGMSDAEVDEAIYQRARQVVIGLIQHITYNEFLPSTLGFNALGTYKGYDASVNPQILNEFATATYRIGHTTLPNELQIGSGGESLPLAEAFFQPGFVYDNGIEGILEGLTLQRMQEVDNHIVDGVRNFLIGGPGEELRMDLAALNIQRGRDHGLPDFNTMRVAIGLDPISDFSELTSDAELAQLFEDVYGTPDNADPWIAMISEDHVPGTMTGETMYAYLVDQFHRLRVGDRFYFENALEQDLIDVIKATRLSDVIERNTNLDVQDEVFWTRDTLVFRNGLNAEWLIRDFGDNGGAEVVLTGVPGSRDKGNQTEISFVQRDEPINAVIVAGTNRRGDGFYIPTAEVPSPQNRRGNDEFVITADIDFFEGYGLGGNDVWEFESDIDSIFASGDKGRDLLYATTDLEDGKVAFTGGSGRDEISIYAPNAYSIIATGDRGSDLIWINGNNAYSIHADGGSGRDYIFVHAATAASVKVLGGRGSDYLWIQAKHAEKLVAHGHGGRDHMKILVGSQTEKYIFGGPGRDQVEVAIYGREHNRRDRFRNQLLDNEFASALEDTFAGNELGGIS